jgi:hypothetical protein
LGIDIDVEACTDSICRPAKKGCYMHNGGSGLIVAAERVVVTVVGNDRKMSYLRKFRYELRLRLRYKVRSEIR